MKTEDLPEGVKKCTDCRGRGSVMKAPYKIDTCPTCEGKGFIVDDIDKEIEALLGKRS